MNIYQYSAKNKEGRSVIGKLEAVSENEASELLHKKDLVVISIKKVKASQINLKINKVKPSDLVIFTRQLSTLVDAGIPLVQSLGILEDQVENQDMKNVVIILRQDIEGGMNFCDALAKHPQVFSELYINMSRAGEASGILHETLDRLAVYLEKSLILTRKIRTSLAYPALVVIMAIIITTILLVKVVPTFSGIFELLGGDLPVPTRILIFVSDLLRHYFLIVLGILVAAGFLFKKYIDTEGGRYNFDLYILKVPVIGVLLRKFALAKFSRTFSTLVKSGVNVLNALDIVAKTTGNKVIEKATIECRKGVREGEPIWQSLIKSKVFPSMLCHMIGVGEKTGQLEKMLAKVADFYEDQVDAQVTALTSMIEPLVIAFLGIVIGGIVVALFLPVFKITELVAK